jgi:hypothetical protein
VLGPEVAGLLQRRVGELLQRQGAEVVVHWSAGHGCDPTHRRVRAEPDSGAGRARLGDTRW